MRGGRALPKFFVHFSQNVYIGSIWEWGRRERPLPKFFGTLAFKKVVQVVQIRGRGGQGNLDKIQKNSYFFRETVPNTWWGWKLDVTTIRFGLINMLPPLYSAMKG